MDHAFDLVLRLGAEQGKNFGIGEAPLRADDGGIELRVLRRFAGLRRVHVHEGELRHGRFLGRRRRGEGFLQLRRLGLGLVELHQERGGIEFRRLGLEPVQPREVRQVRAELPRQHDHDVRDDGAHERQHEQARLVASRSPRFVCCQIHGGQSSRRGGRAEGEVHWTRTSAPSDGLGRWFCSTVPPASSYRSPSHAARS